MINLNEQINQECQKVDQVIENTEGDKWAGLKEYLSHQDDILVSFPRVDILDKEITN
jgi:hypothetical protein